MKRAILYSRVSTPKQAELYSLEYQLEQERSYSRDMGFEIVAEFADDMSGRKMDRDGLIEARLMLSENKADVLVVWKLDRLHRSYVNTVVLRDEIQRMGKELYYAQSKTKSGTRAKERLPEDILALMAEIEADEIAERTTMGKRQKALSGKWIGLYKPPYGYTATGQRQNRQAVIDEDQGRIVRLIYEWFVYGDETNSGFSIAEIVEKLSALGIPTPADNLANPHFEKKRAYGEWSRTTIYRILHEPAYKGTFYQFRRKQITGQSRRNPNQDDFVAVPFPVIIDEETWELAQEKITDGRNLPKWSGKYEFLLARRVSCECGYKMTGSQWHRNYTRKTDGVATKYIYSQYRCRGRRNDVVNSCTQKTIVASLLDERVWQYVRAEIMNPVILERKLRELQEKQQDERNPILNKLEILTSHRGTIIEELRRLAVLYSKQAMPEHLLTDLIEQQNQKLQLTETEIERLEAETIEPLSDEQILDLVSFSQKLEEKLSAVEEDFSAKRAVIDGLDVQVTVIERDGEQLLEISTLLNPKPILGTLSHASGNVKQGSVKGRILIREIIGIHP